MTSKFGLRSIFQTQNHKKWLHFSVIKKRLNFRWFSSINILLYENHCNSLHVSVVSKIWNKKQNGLLFLHKWIILVALDCKMSMINGHSVAWSHQDFQGSANKGSLWHQKMMHPQKLNHKEIRRWPWLNVYHMPRWIFSRNH